MFDGDISRKRRLIGSESKILWYAHYRSLRFSKSDFKHHHHGEEEKDHSMCLTKTKELFEKFKDLNNEEKWYAPFPMAVFGTLRKGRGNSHRMSNGKIIKHQRAFLPNFIASGLSISFKKNSTAPFEIYFYKDQLEWNKMIPSVDALEGFTPESLTGSFSFEEGRSRGGYGYHRTLAYLRLLPEDYEHPDYHQDVWGHRDLEILSTEWDNYEKVACWIYSSMRQNILAKNESEPIIWG